VKNGFSAVEHPFSRSGPNAPPKPKFDHNQFENVGASLSCHKQTVSQLNRLHKAVITIAIRLRHDYDPATTHRARLLPFDAIRREQKLNMSIFRRSRVVVVS